MATFDFVTDDDLRASLEDDMRQMTACFKVEAYKAAQVLAGSIVEAVLADHLLGIGHMSKKPILEMTLSELVEAARSVGVISAITSDLASVVREYRNLIHPGRVLRLEQKVTDHTARIAKDLVEIIVNDVASRKTATYGYTANQIVRKIESDTSAGAIIGDLLRETPVVELERLLLRVIPGRYLEVASSDIPVDDGPLPGLRRTYHAAMDVAPEDIRRRVMERYIIVLKEQPEFEVLHFEEAFFRSSDLELLPDADARMAKAHLLDQASRNFGARLEGAFAGLGKAATTDELTSAAQSVLQFAAANFSTERRDLCERVLRDLWASAPIGIDGAIPAAIRTWEGGTGPEPWKRWLAGLRRSFRGLFDPPDISTEPSDLDDLPF